VDYISQRLELDFRLSPAIDKWLPGETIYSLGCRQHTVAGNAKASDTCLQLFGHRLIGTAHDLPGRVGHFVRRTKGQFGNAESCIREHTILPYYLPFRSQRESANAVAAMSGESIGALKAQLGILATRFGAAHPLKACKRCVEQDEALHHVAYWHVEHQLPGVWICPWHSDMLWIAQDKWMGVDRFGWYLPTDTKLAPCTDADVRQPDLDVLKRLADSSVALWSLPSGFHFSPEKLGNLISSAMRERELSSDSGRIRLNAFSSAITEVTHTLVGIRELSSLPSSVDQARSQFTRIVSAPRSSPHPLKYQILILALFGTWESFLERHVAKDISATSVVYLSGKHASSDNTDKRAEFLSALAETKASMNSLAHKFDISVSTAMVWAASAGIASKRRPKILMLDVRKKLIRILRRGIGKKSVAKGFGISIQTITTTLRTEIGLHERWTQARFKRAQSEARNAWAETARNQSNPTSKSMRLLQPAVFAWLYRNDRAWLERFASQLGHAPKHNHANIDWDQRDIELAKAIKSAALDWYSRSNTHLTNARLCQLVPGFKSRLSKLDRLPLTRAVLSQIPQFKLEQCQESLKLW